MNDTNIPQGWKTIDDAATTIGVESQELLHWAQGIDPEGDYTPGGAVAKPNEQGIVKGRDIVASVDGQLVMCDAAVESWRLAEKEYRELQAKGWSTPAEAAKQIGISEVELEQELEAFKATARDMGISEAELLRRMSKKKLEDGAE